MVPRAPATPLGLIETFLDHVSAAGSPALQQVISAGRTRTPLGLFAGTTMEEARAALVGYPTLYLPLVAAP
jgi:hypothetical protein